MNAKVSNEQLLRALENWRLIGEQALKKHEESLKEIKTLQEDLSETKAMIVKDNEIIAQMGRNFYKVQQQYIDLEEKYRSLLDASTSPVYIVRELKALLPVVLSAVKFAHGIDASNDHHRINYRLLMRRVNELKLTHPDTIVEILNYIESLEDSNRRLRKDMGERTK